MGRLAYRVMSKHWGGKLHTAFFACGCDREAVATYCALVYRNSPFHFFVRSNLSPPLLMDALGFYPCLFPVASLPAYGRLPSRFPTALK